MFFSNSPGQEQDLAEAIRKLDANFHPANSAQAKVLREMVGKEVRARRDVVNQRETKLWENIKTKEDWERYRDERLKALRESLGQFPPVPKDLKIRITGKKTGDGFVVENLVFESRPGLLVTANLYRPRESAKAGPGILIIHSHHNPKTQGELQDMGMTWARQGCLVLVPDQLGHGERRQHPFTDKTKYDGDFKPSRQDYYFRYNVAMQLHLIGDSLMGWMVWDTMRGVDLLLQRGADPKRIILMGSVAGGGDPCAVAAALDKRITAAVPFNFGGPQPETRFPLPDDATTFFNYAGGGSWESTRNLRLSCRDGFLPWLIVGSQAPRGLIYAHEFAWDQKHDPVWRRLQKIYGFYDAQDRLAWTKGKGSVKGKAGPDNTHCNNIGAAHRERIYPALQKWFDMPVPEKEYRKRFETKDLLCLTPEIEKKPLFELAGEIGGQRAEAARKRLAKSSVEQGRQHLRQEWARLLNSPKLVDADVDFVRKSKLGKDVFVWSVVLRTGDKSDRMDIPLLLLIPSDEQRIVVAVAQEGKPGFLKHRAETIAGLLKAKVAVCLPDLRGTGESKLGDSRGRASYSTSISATELMLGRTMLGDRLHDLRTVLKFLRGPDVGAQNVALWGDSFAPVNSPETPVAVALDATKLPPQSEPLGGLLAVFGALYEPNVKAVYVRGGLAGYQSILQSPFCYVPHDVIVPGALTAGDLCDVAAALAPRPLRLEGLVDGLNRSVSADALKQIYEPTLAAYRTADAAKHLTLRRETLSQKQLAEWLAAQLK
jgi:dienelactone hydrolase